MTELERWLPTLQPPAGGLQHLQQSLGGQPQSSFAWLSMQTLPLIATASVVTFVMLSLMLTSRTLAPPVQAERVAVVLGSLAHQPPTTLRIEQGDATEVSAPGASVRVFLVMTR